MRMGSSIMQLLTLPYVQNYGWAINVLEMTVIDDPLQWKSRFRLGKPAVMPRLGVQE